MDKAVFVDMSDDELVDYASLCQWVNENLTEGVQEMICADHSMRVLNAVVKNFSEDRWAVELTPGKDGSVLKFSPNLPKQKDNKPADCGIHPVST